METIVSSAGRKAVIADGRPCVLVGERINPSGKRKLADSLKEGNLDIVRNEALAQTQAGADIIDINVSTFGVDEVNLLPEAVKAAMEAVDTPLCLDSANPAALAAALRVYRGKPLINSVTGEEHSLAKVLPLVREHGAAVVGMTQDDEGIPKDAERRIAVAHKIVERAQAAGIPIQDIVIDCMAFAVGADPESGMAVILAIRRIREELAVNVALGASNVSFGLPERDLLNRAFVAMAIAAGANCLIADVAKIRPAVLAADLILGRDQRARRYIDFYRQHHSHPGR